jgi:hypothetical protein
MYSTQSYWVFGLFPPSCVLGSRNTTFRKLDLFPSSGERGRRHLETKTDPVSETSCFYSTKDRTMEKVQNPVTLCPF